MILIHIVEFYEPEMQCLEIIRGYIFLIHQFFDFLVFVK